MTTCLIIDNSEVVCKVAATILGSMNYRVRSTTHADEAIIVCQKTQPDVVVIDWQLQGIDTHKLISDLRQHTEKKQPYIIYCTTENDPVDLAQAMSAGADDYLLKPFDRSTIEAKFASIPLLPA